MEIPPLLWVSLIVGIIELIWVQLRGYNKKWISVLMLLFFVIAAITFMVVLDADCSQDKSSCGGLTLHVLWLILGSVAMAVINTVLLCFIVGQEAPNPKNKTNK